MRRHREDLRHEQRIAAGSVRNPLTQVRGHLLTDEDCHVRVGKRLETQPKRPRRSALDQLRPRQAKKQDRSSGGKQRHVLDEIEKRLFTPLDVVEHANERCLLFEQPTERNSDLVGRCERR